MWNQTSLHAEKEKHVYTEEKIISICGECASQNSKPGQMNESGMNIELISFCINQRWHFIFREYFLKLRQMKTIMLVKSGVI